MERFLSLCHVVPLSCETKIPSRPPTHKPPPSSTAIAASCVNIAGRFTGAHVWPPSDESTADLKVAAKTHDFAEATKLQSSFSGPAINFQLSPAVTLRNNPSEVAA